MTLDRGTLTWILAGGLFAIASLWIHHQVKVVMSRGTVVDRIGDLRVGDSAPDLVATDLDGQPVALSGFRGRQVVVVDFWATWCGPCLMAMPELQEIADDFDGQVEVLAVNLGEEPARIRRFIDRKGYTFRVIEDRDASIAERFGVESLPSQVVVGRDGRIASIRVGYRPGDGSLRALLERLTDGAAIL